MQIDDDDDLDPLAPRHYTSELDETQVEDATDGGVCDSRKVVRVWVEDGRLTRVRVSPTWVTKLQGQHLSDSFAQALAIASVSVAEPLEREPDTPIRVPPDTVPPLTASTVNEIQAMLDDIDRRWDETMSSPPASAPTAEPVTGRSEGVTVTLGPTGRARTVDFTDAWLDEANAGDICTHVMRAAERAYSRFTPPPMPPDPLGGLRTEHKVVTAVLRAMLNPEGSS